MDAAEGPPKRRKHQSGGLFGVRLAAEKALDALSVGLLKRKVNWVQDADIQGFFDNISHEKLLKLLELRIGDRRVLVLLRKWLTAGVSEDGEWSSFGTRTTS
ncbi:MAG: hypothetical protein ACKV2Q_30445 [Planctomycetaceae bacterium]